MHLLPKATAVLSQLVGCFQVIVCLTYKLVSVARVTIQITHSHHQVMVITSAIRTPSQLPPELVAASASCRLTCRVPDKAASDHHHHQAQAHQTRLLTQANLLAHVVLLIMLLQPSSRSHRQSTLQWRGWSKPYQQRHRKFMLK